ncbi:hypothetical protein NIES30_22075 [Phormidium tenue NIES-30]|uniref:Uncharacterized protein n=1 Tax=Phormidium tenue NIES-30 TaxID=549789 RepID=A0A1U7IZL2_9CYAN|nr:hypothetical protein NIES30_22075 [Phormidium tenue NIES-30]
MKDGCAYQCYAAQEPCTVEQRYNAQRNKITTDIGKFITNEKDLSRVFGATTIHRWILVVPISESALLMQHASKKTEEVLNAKLPYVAHDFKVMIETDLCFQKEINELAKVGVFEVDLPDLSVEQEFMKIWIEGNIKTLNNLEHKSIKLLSSSEEQKVEKFQRIMIDRYLVGQNYLDLLKNKYPEMYFQISHCKLSYERHLEVMSEISDSSPRQHFDNSLVEYGQRLEGSLTYKLPYSSIQNLQWEAMSDWMMRCPLNFN